jgi:sRNA-binding regulator protein Hfq
LALEKNSNKYEEKEKKAPVFSVVYLLNGSQLLGEAALGQHR